MTVFVNSDNFEEEVINSSIPVLADFYSESCLPCKRISPVVSELDAQFGGRLKTVKIKVCTSYELTIKYNISSTPTLVLFGGGEELERITGYKPKEEIEDIINKYI